MKKFLRIKTWFVRLFSPDKKTLGAIGEDLRKVAVTAIGVGIVGLAVSGDTITVEEAGLVLVIGVILWIYGIGGFHGVRNRADPQVATSRASAHLYRLATGGRRTSARSSSFSV